MLKDKDYIGRRIFSAAFNVLHKNKLINSCEIHVQALVILTEKCYNNNVCTVHLLLRRNKMEKNIKNTENEKFLKITICDNDKSIFNSIIKKI